MMVVEIIGLNMITASISAIFGLVLAAITNRMRRKNIVKTIATIGMSVLFFPDKRNGKQNQQYAQYGRRFYRDG